MIVCVWYVFVNACCIVNVVPVNCKCKRIISLEPQITTVSHANHWLKVVDNWLPIFHSQQSQKDSIAHSCIFGPTLKSACIFCPVTLLCDCNKIYIVLLRKSPERSLKAVKALYHSHYCMNSDTTWLTKVALYRGFLVPVFDSLGYLYFLVTFTMFTKFIPMLPTVQW